MTTHYKPCANGKSCRNPNGAWQPVSEFRFKDRYTLTCATCRADTQRRQQAQRARRRAAQPQRPSNADIPPAYAHHLRGWLLSMVIRRAGHQATRPINVEE